MAHSAGEGCRYVFVLAEISCPNMMFAGRVGSGEEVVDPLVSVHLGEDEKVPAYLTLSTRSGKNRADCHTLHPTASSTARSFEYLLESAFAAHGVQTWC